MKKLVLSGVVFDASKKHNGYTYQKECINIVSDVIPLCKSYNELDVVIGMMTIQLEKNENGYDILMGECEIFRDDDSDKYISDLIEYSTVNISHDLTFSLYAVRARCNNNIVVKMEPSRIVIIPRHLNSDPTQSQINISLRRVKDENNI